MLPALLFALFQDTKPAEPAPFGPTEIGVAAEVLGLHYTEKELELMLPDVLERLKEFERLRAVPLGNEVAPVLHFQPLPGARGPGDSSMVRTFHAPFERPANLEELAFMSIPEIGALVVQRKVSCVEVAQVFLDRLERLDEKLHCVVTLLRERALAQASMLDLQIEDNIVSAVSKPLYGIPWVAKDLLAAKGSPTTWGTPPFRDQTIDHDAAVVEKLDAAGAVLIAKVSLGELAWGDVWFGGKTRNPWKPDEGSSGSSAGSASAVAAGCATFAIGSETYGSIVSPSHACGTSSLRPTFGRVSRHGAMTLCWSLDKLGPICRSAEDAALVFHEIQGYDERDPSTVDRPLELDLEQDIKGWKVGFPKGAFDGDGERCKHVLDELKALGIELVEVELPKYPVDEMMIVLAAEAGAAFDDFSRGDGDDRMVRQERHAWPNVFRHAQLIPAVDYIRANRLRTLLIRDYQSVLSPLACIVHPSYSGSILAATNLSGHPTFVAPCGFGAEGKPFSVSFTGKLFGEGELLAVARAWQRSTDHEDRHPKL